MTEKQKRFADEYIIDCNATRAYKTAYPHVKNDNVANTAGSRMLANVKVKAYLDKRLKEISSAKTATAQEVMEYLSSVLRGEATDERIGIDETYEIRVSHRERLKAAEMLSKRFGLLQPDNDNKEVLEKLDSVLEKIEGSK